MTPNELVQVFREEVHHHVEILLFLFLLKKRFFDSHNIWMVQHLQNVQFSILVLRILEYAFYSHLTFGKSVNALVKDVLLCKLSRTSRSQLAARYRNSERDRLQIFSPLFLL